MLKFFNRTPIHYQSYSSGVGIPGNKIVLSKIFSHNMKKDKNLFVTLNEIPNFEKLYISDGRMVFVNSFSIEQTNECILSTIFKIDPETNSKFKLCNPDTINQRMEIMKELLPDVSIREFYEDVDYTNEDLFRPLLKEELRFPIEEIDLQSDKSIKSLVGNYVMGIY